ncbi:MAG: SDR family oxidoreductase [Microbacteriaceae bacterium]
MTRHNDLSAKVIAVTGGARGIGHEIARQLAAAGARVALGDRDGDAARHAAQTLPGTLIGLDLDVASSESFAAFLSAVEKEWGPIDILINNAGVMWAGSFDDEPEQATHQQIAVNLLGVITSIKLAAPAMVTRGSGHIITVASAASILTTPGEAVYAATKHGVLGYIKAVRAELHRTPVRFSVIMPTVVQTAMSEGTGTGAARILQPADVAAAVLRTIARPRFEVTIPGYVGPVLAAVNLLPGWLRDPISRGLVPDQVRLVNRGARRDYDAQFDNRT